MKKAIVTGASGFIGKALCKYLLQNEYFVYAIVRNKESLDDIKLLENIIILECDFSDYNKIGQLINDDIDIFYHFAWSGVSGTDFKNYNIQLGNIKSGCDALMVAAKMGVEKFVLAGSSHEFKVEKISQNGTIQLRRCCIYGTAKLSCELMCKTLALQNNIKFNSVIFTNVFGVGDKSNRSTNAILKKMISNDVPKLVLGNDLYDWTYIDDAIGGIFAVGEKGIDSKTYYIGSSNLRKLKHIIEEVRDIVSPNMKLVFGEFEDNSFIDYSNINTYELYEDTDYLPSSNFKESILKTVAWLNECKL